MTELGSDGSSRDQRTFTPPILARHSRPLGRRANPLRVNLADCRVSLRDLNLGRPTRLPRRLPFTASKKFRNARSASRTDCTNATLATSPSHARASVVLATVTTLRWTSVGLIFSPARYAWSRQRSASLNTVRQHPNVRASHCC